MQSSTAIAFRALIMLIFMICVPLVAIFGRDLPEVIKGLLDGRISVQVTEQNKVATTPAAPQAVTPPNNPFADAAPYRAGPAPAAMPPAAIPAAATPNMQTAGPVVPAADFPAGPAPAAVPAVGFLPPANGPASVPPPSNPYSEPSNPTANWPNIAAAQTPPDAFNPPQDARPAAASEPAGPEGTAALTSGDNAFRQIGARLRELGAANYRLETWGAQNEQYRFECRMSIGGNIGVTQHFEAVEDDPLRAMENVLRQVDDWQRRAAM
jgi:hypothetical protein